MGAALGSETKMGKLCEFSEWSRLFWALGNYLRFFFLSLLPSQDGNIIVSVSQGVPED